MASGVSYVPARISDRHHNCRDLNQALHILGFGSWNELWPGKTISVKINIIHTFMLYVWSQQGDAYHIKLLYLFKTETERHNVDYVPMKINESLSEKMSQLEEPNEPNKANKKHKETPSNTKIANGKKKVKTRNKKDNKKDNLKGNNSIEKKREIHEAYQVVLNEYHRKLDLRRKSLDQTNTFRRRSILHAELKAYVKDTSEAVAGMYLFVIH